MLILIVENYESNSGITSLIEAYQKQSHTLAYIHYNFFSSNLSIDVLHIQWSENFSPSSQPHTQKPVIHPDA